MTQLSFKIDGRLLQARDGETLLQVARRAGIEIPSLCDHPALEPVGACRLCLVEVGHPDWKGWSGLMTACLYPAAAGLEVQTDSPRVQRARRQVLSLLLARCPDAPEIQSLAARYGASATGLSLDPQADRCILCGLCARVCESHATAALTTFGRGSAKRVGAFLDRAPEECVGCGACASLCPTRNIPVSDTGSSFQLWGRSFLAAVCTVDEQRCVGCGSCEEACPFAVARVTLRLGGGKAAQIPAEHCRGCGACLGACPTGAIDQAAPYQTKDLVARLRRGAADEPRRLAVVACPRSALSPADLPAGADLLELPCSGRVSLPLLLELAASYQGVLVLGRHPESCRLGGAEAVAADRCARAAALLALGGGEEGQVHFACAESGVDGPRRTVRRFVEALRAPSQPRPEPAPLEGEGLLDGLQRQRRMVAEADGARPGVGVLAALGLPKAAPGAAALDAGELLWVHHLAGAWLRPLSVPELLRQALEVLAALGFDGAGIALGPHSGERFALGCEDVGPAAAGEASRDLGQLLRRQGQRLPRPPRPALIAFDGQPLGLALLEALGYRPLSLGPDPLPAHFGLGAEDRRRAESRLQEAERLGAQALLVSSPEAWVSWGLLTRQGSWRADRLRPLLGHQLAWLSLRGLGLDLRPASALAGRLVAEVMP